MDEYYFWLIDSRYFDNAPLPAGVQPPEATTATNSASRTTSTTRQQQSAVWQDPTQLPQLLAWQPQPWCGSPGAACITASSVSRAARIRRSRCSPAGPSISSSPAQRRLADFFRSRRGIAPLGYADPSPPGFRYDLPPTRRSSCRRCRPRAPRRLSVGGLPAYPYFAYSTPARRLSPLSVRPALAVAEALRGALPLRGRAAWYRAPSTRCNRTAPGSSATSDSQRPATGSQRRPQTQPRTPAAAERHAACCDSTDVTCDKASDRAVLLHYCETLLDWGDALMRRRGNSPEAFQQARVLFDTAARILGTRPRARCDCQPPAAPPTVAAFTPAFAPLNPRLMDLYDDVADRLALIRACLDARACRMPPGAAMDPTSATARCATAGAPSAGPCARRAATGAICPAPTASRS